MPADTTAPETKPGRPWWCLVRMITNLLIGVMAVYGGAVGILVGVNDLRHPTAYQTDDLLFGGLFATCLVPGTAMVLASLFFFVAVLKRRKDLYRKSQRFQIAAMVAHVLPAAMLVTNFSHTSQHGGEWAGWGVLGLIVIAIAFLLALLWACMTLVVLKSTTVQRYFADPTDPSPIP